MQSILSIDASCDPAAAVVVQVDGNSAVVQEIHRFQIGPLFSREALLDAELNSTVPSLQTDGAAAIASQPQVSGIDELKRVLSEIKTPWTSAILMVPPHDYLSFNIDLPFARTKGMDKIVDLEVQDLVPFDLHNFLVQYRALGQLTEKSQDIHVSLLPRNAVGKILETCKKVGFEPGLVTTPAGVLGAVALLGAELPSNTSAVILAREPFVYLSIMIDGIARMDRIINRGSLSQPAHTLIDAATIREIRSALLSAEKRYGKKIEQICLLGGYDVSDLSAGLGAPVLSISMPELVRSADNSTAIACLASLYAQDIDAPPILTNFRIKEFAYSPQLRELLGGIRTLLPYFLATLLASAILLVGMYSLRERRLHNMRAAIRDQIKSAVPVLDVPAGSELDGLEGENRKLEAQLSNLGSLSALSPLDYIAEISEDLPLSSGITVTRVKVEGNKMRVDGTAPDYTAMEKIERLLKKKKTVYCRIRKDTTATVPGRPNVRGFSLDIVLCE